MISVIDGDVAAEGPTINGANLLGTIRLGHGTDPSVGECNVQSDAISDQQAVLEAHDLTKRYDTGEMTVTAVHSLDLAVDPGEVFGFLGPNGAGKSTTINMLLGFVQPTAGSARILGADSYRDSESIRSRIGVLPEGVGLYERLTGRRHLEFAIRWKDATDEPDRLLDRVGLSAADADRRVGQYSTGMRQRLALAMALVGDPALVVLDEPSSGLDPHGIRRLRQIVREEADRGATVFFSSHLLDQVEAVADRIGILYDGELVAVDDIGGLRRIVGSGTELQVRVADPVTSDLTTISGVDDWRATDGIVRVQTSDPAAKARVITHLVEQGVTVLDVDSSEASLEDVFTAYTTGDTSARMNGDHPVDEQEVTVR